MPLKGHCQGLAGGLTDDYPPHCLPVPSEAGVPCRCTYEKEAAQQAQPLSRARLCSGRVLRPEEGPPLAPGAGGHPLKPRVTRVSLGEAGDLLAPFSRELLASVPSTGLAASKSPAGTGGRGVMPPALRSAAGWELQPGGG